MIKYLFPILLLGCISPQVCERDTVEFISMLDEACSTVCEFTGWEAWIDGWITTPECGVKDLRCSCCPEDNSVCLRATIDEVRYEE